MAWYYNAPRPQRRPLDTPVRPAGGTGGGPTGPGGGDLGAVGSTYPNPTIAPGAVTDAKIASVAYAKVTGAPTSLPPTGAATGSLTGTYPAPTIAANAVGTAQLADASVTWPKIGGQLYARVSRSAVLALSTSGSGVVITFDSIDTNVGGLFNVANPSRLTFPADGFYLVGGSCEFAAAANGLRRVQVLPSAGAGLASLDMPGGQWNGTTWVAGVRRLVLSGARFFSAGQFVELQAMQDSGAALNVSAGAIFWACRVG